MIKVSLEAQFTAQDIEDMITEDINAWFEDLKEDCRAAAKKFVDKVISGQLYGEKTWKNRTWNLRSSIGYLLVFNGKIVEEYFPESKGSEGNKEGRNYAEEIASLVNDGEGFQIVIVAGMEYAVFVEGNNLDVLTHASKGFPKILITEFKKSAA